MYIDDLIAKLKATLKTGNEDDLLDLIYFGMDKPDEFLKQMALLPFVSLYHKNISITYKPFRDLPEYQQARYQNRDGIDYIIYFHYADAEQETDNSAPAGKIDNSYKILL